jgi:hypothetical protein
LTICLTEILSMSDVVRKENERLVGVDGREVLMSIALAARRADDGVGPAGGRRGGGRGGREGRGERGQGEQEREKVKKDGGSKMGHNARTVRFGRASPCHHHPRRFLTRRASTRTSV